MLYVSELLGKKVVTTDGICIGELDDLIIRLDDRDPRVTKIRVKGKDEKISVDARSLYKFGRVVRIHKSYTVAELEENELFVKKNILDKQIIDISGNKIVRANDILLQERVNLNSNVYECYLSGVDIGILGFLRRLAIEDAVVQLLSLFRIKLVSRFLSWGDIQPLELSTGQIRLKKDEDKIEKMRPEDLADYLERTNERNIRKFLRLLDKEFAAEVVSNLGINYQRDLFRMWKPDRSAEIIKYMDPDNAVDILLLVSARKREEILKLLPPHVHETYLHLIQLSKTPIGARITSDFLTVSSTASVKEVSALIRKKTADFTFFSSVYVINEKSQLVGVFSLHELLLHDPETPVYKFMVQNLVEARLKTPVELVIAKMLKYHIPAIPIVNSGRQLLGIVTFDNVADIIEAKFKK